MCVTPHRFLWSAQVKTPSSNFPPVPPRQPTPLILPINYLTVTLTRIPVAFNHSTTFPNLQQAVTIAFHPLANSHTLSLTHSFIHSLTLSLPNSLTFSFAISLFQSQSLTYTLTHTHSLWLTHSYVHSLTCTLTRTLILSLVHLHTHTLFHSLIHSFTHPFFYALTIPFAHSLTYSLAHLLAHCYVHYRLSSARPHSWTHSLINCHKQNIRGPLHWNDC